MKLKKKKIIGVEVFVCIILISIAIFMSPLTENNTNPPNKDGVQLVTIKGDTLIGKLIKP